MENTAAGSTLAKVFGAIAAVLGFSGWALVLTSAGPNGPTIFIVGILLFAPGLLLAIASVVIGFVKRPRTLVIPFIALAVNIFPAVVFVFFLSVLQGMG